ncbi:unnamed protein product [Leptosia nina]|uniref:Sugar phosphate transporter domain-containing protein n=1 Tax=Leptosia nina TaxID=320188 RepID=A0AAV1JV54_9NEOP
MRVRSETLIVSALCAAWYALSSASNVVGKLALNDFPFPLTMTLVQLVATTTLSAPALAAFGVPQIYASSRAPRLRALLPLAIAKFLTTVFSQLSIWKVPVSYAHTVKATTPLWTAGMAWAIFKERVSRGVCGALALIASGVVLASATELHFDAVGLAAALAAAALLSLQHLLSKRLLQNTTVHHLRLLQTLSALALIPLLPVWLVAEGRAVWMWRGSGSGDGLRLSILVAADGVLAWLQAIAAFTVLSHVSPLTYGVASAAKRAVVVLGSLLLLRNPAPPLNLLGMALAVLGVFAYNRVKIRKSQPPTLLPV